MARIRTIKPEYWSSEQVMTCCPMARLLFIGLWNFCDDGGNHPLSPRTIKALIFPGDDITTEEVSALLGELQSAELIDQYWWNGKLYFHVCGWQHQKIEKKNFKHPAYPGPIRAESPTESHQSADDSPTDSGSVVDESSTGSQPVDPGRDVDVEGNGEDQDQHHSLNACEEIPPVELEQDRTTEESSVVAADPTMAKIAMVQLDPEPTPEPVDPKAPVEMTLDWLPDHNLLKTYSVHFCVPMEAFTPEAIAPFTAHHESNGSLNTHAKWVSLLAKWVRDDKNRANNVRPFVKPQPKSIHMGFSQRDYTDGLTAREDGTYAF